MFATLRHRQLSQGIADIVLAMFWGLAFSAFKEVLLIRELLGHSEHRRSLHPTPLLTYPIWLAVFWENLLLSFPNVNNTTILIRVQTGETRENLLNV